jgi:prevent-host-death family protein
MSPVTIHEAKTHLSRLVDAALAGEEVIIARRNKPLVQLTAIRPEKLSRRRIGMLPNLIKRMNDAFDDECSDWETGVIPPPNRPNRRARKKR